MPPVMSSITSVGLSSAVGLTILKAAMAQPAMAAQLVTGGGAPGAPVVSGADAGAMLAAALQTLVRQDAGAALAAIEANQPALPQFSPE